MLSHKSDYLYTDEATLARIKVDGNILPKRGQHQTLRSEDVTYLNECAQERALFSRDEVAVRSYPVPKLDGGLIVKSVSRSNWYTEGILSSAMLLVREETSYVGAEDEALFDSLRNLLQEYHSIEAPAAAKRQEAETKAREALVNRLEPIDPQYREELQRAKAEYERAKSEETRRHADLVERENEDYADERTRIDRQIASIEGDESLSPGERRQQIAKKNDELAELSLEHERKLFDEGFEHDRMVREYTAARQTAIDEAERVKEEHEQAASDEYSRAVGKAASEYNAALVSIKAQLAAAAQPIVDDRSGYSGYVQALAWDAAGYAGLDTRTQGAVERDERIAGSEADHFRSAVSQIRDGHWEIHQGLMYWALYSDYERMEVVRLFGSTVPDAVLMRFQFESTPLSQDRYEAPDEVGQAGNIRDVHGHSYSDGGYYVASTNQVRFYVPITDREAVDRIDGIYVELMLNVYGEERHDRENPEYHSVDRTYYVIVEGSVEDPCPRYHAEQDAIIEKYDGRLEEINKNADGAVASRTASCDAAVAAEERAYAEAVERYRKARDMRIASARKSAASSIDRITRTANTAAAASDNPASVIRRAISDVAAVRQELEKEINSADSEYAKRESDQSQQMGLAIEKLRSQRALDVQEIEEKRRENVGETNLSRQEALSELRRTYLDKRSAAEAKYHEDLREAYESHYENYPSRADYESYEEFKEACDAADAAYVATQSGIAADAVAAINECEAPSDYRICVAVDGSRVLNVEGSLPNAGVFRTVECANVYVKPHLRTLTGADYPRFDDYYKDKAEGDEDEDDTD